MPTYVYRRPDGTTFEVFQKISDAPLAQDPDSGVPVQRVISGGAGLQFKGDGFYLTDYVHSKDKGRTEGAKAEAKAEAGDTKPAKKAEATEKAKPAPAKKASSDD